MNDIALRETEMATSIGETTETAWIAPANMSYEDWCSVGRTLQVIHKSINFWIGDWLNTGERRFGEMAMQAVEETGRSVESLLKCKAVAARFAPEDRFERLSWSHHLAAAYIDEDFRHDVLSMAATYEISTRDLKTLIQLPVRFLGDLIRCHRDGVRTAEFYRLLELKRLEAIEWDKPAVRIESDERYDAIDGESTYIAPADDEEEAERDNEEPEDELPFVDLGDSASYDWSDDVDMDQNMDTVFSFFEAHGVPLKAAYIAEVVWQGLAVRAEISREGQPFLVWEIVP